MLNKAVASVAQYMLHLFLSVFHFQYLKHYRGFIQCVLPPQMYGAGHVGAGGYFSCPGKKQMRCPVNAAAVYPFSIRSDQMVGVRHCAVRYGIYQWVSPIRMRKPTPSSSSR